MQRTIQIVKACWKQKKPYLSIYDSNEIVHRFVLQCVISLWLRFIIYLDTFVWRSHSASHILNFESMNLSIRILRTCDVFWYYFIFRFTVKAYLTYTLVIFLFGNVLLCFGCSWHLDIEINQLNSLYFSGMLCLLHK